MSDSMGWFSFTFGMLFPCFCVYVYILRKWSERCTFKNSKTTIVLDIYIEFEMVTYVTKGVNETMGSFEEIVLETKSQAGKEWWGHFSFKK